MRRQDPDAWRRLARHYAPLVYAWCRRVGLQPSDCEDVLQEVFLTVAGRIKDFRHEGPNDTFRGWLWAITRNKIGDLIRRQARTPRACGGSTGLELLHAQPDLAAEEGNDEAPLPSPGGPHQGAVEVVRGEFAERTWQAFWLVVVEQRAPADVADELGISRNAVYIARSRVLHRLRAVLGAGRRTVSGPPSQGVALGY